MDIITNLESKIKDLKERIAENEVTIHNKQAVIDNLHYVDTDVISFIKIINKQIFNYRVENERLNIRLCRYNHLIEYIKKHNRVQVAYVVYGENGHRQRASWDESNTIIHNDNAISFLNADITGHHDYSIVIITASNREECESELYGQLSDGVFENCNHGEIVELDSCDDFINNVEVMATIGVDEFIRR